MGKSGAWLFAERLLCVDWLEQRTLSLMLRRQATHVASTWPRTGMVGG